MILKEGNYVDEGLLTLVIFSFNSVLEGQSYDEEHHSKRVKVQ